MARDMAEAHTEVAAQATTLFGERVNLDRLAAGLTRIELAERTGLSASYVARIERGCANVTLDAMVRMAEALGCEVSDMLTPRS